MATILLGSLENARAGLQRGSRLSRPGWLPRIRRRCGAVTMPFRARERARKSARKDTPAGMPVSLSGRGRGLRSGRTLAWGFVGSEATDALRNVLDCDVFELVAQGWCVAKELQE